MKPLAFLLALVSLSATGSPWPAWLDTPDAVISSQPLNTQVRQFTTLGDALRELGQRGTKSLTVYLAPGYYRERVEIDRDNLRLVGAGQELTRISYGRYAGQSVPDGEEGETWGTFRTATLRINAKGVTLADLTVENSFDFPANERRPPGDPEKIRGEQAVALQITAEADRTLVQRVTLEGYQDTLYVEGKRSYVLDSRILGHVDFIFGRGNALFENSDIVSRARFKNNGHTGYVTAPSTLISQEFGLTFLRCRLLREPGVPDDSVPLGRPWHPTTTFADGRYANPYAIGKSVFLHSFLDGHIAGEGWASMGGTAPDGSRRAFTPADARFFEYRNHGPGALVNDKRPQLSDAEAAQYRMQNLFGDWQPALLAAGS